MFIHSFTLIPTDIHLTNEETRLITIIEVSKQFLRSKWNLSITWDSQGALVLIFHPEHSHFLWLFDSVP